MAELTPTSCTTRRQRLIGLLESLQLNAVVLSDVRDIYYFVGNLLPADLPALLVLDDAGSTSLIGPAECEVSGIDTHLSYEWNHLGTRHPEPVLRLVKAAQESGLGGQWKRVGIQRGNLLFALREILSDETELVQIDGFLAEMQSRKDPDEIEVIRESIRANLGAYAAVRRAIQPGVLELDVLAAGIQGAMSTAGEKVFHDGDYQCGGYNGPARNRPIEAGELYIVDAWTCYRGYWSDMSRTFVVGHESSDVQQALFEHIRSVQREVPNLLRPDVDGTEIYQALDELIRQHPPLAKQGLIHHGGHAIGIRAHEMPDINRDRGGRLEPGNVICVEPGGYFAEARYGVRLENIYLITENGCEELCPGDVVLHQCS